jgi:hypothetical protein
MQSQTTVRCACGNVEIAATGAPITSLACYCDDCQEGSRQAEALPGARPVRDSAGGTAYLLYRKDRIACVRGAELLRELKIREQSATSRMVATCCNSVLYMHFSDAKHWAPVYRTGFAGDVVPLKIRIFTKFKPANAAIPTDVASYRTFPVKFLAQLLAAKIAMVVGR